MGLPAESQGMPAPVSLSTMIPHEPSMGQDVAGMHLLPLQVPSVSGLSTMPLVSEPQHSHQVTVGPLGSHQFMSASVPAGPADSMVMPVSGSVAPSEGMGMGLAMQGLRPQGLASGMINLSDLQPGVPPPLVTSAPMTDKQPEPQPQVLDTLPLVLQQDALFVRSVQSQDVAQAAASAQRVLRALLVKDAGIVHPAMQAAGGGFYAGQKVVLHDPNRSLSNQGHGQEAVVVQVFPDDWLQVRMTASGEMLRVPQKMASPVSSDIHFSQDLLDPELFEGVDELLGGTDNGLMLDTHSLNTGSNHGTTGMQATEGTMSTGVPYHPAATLPGKHMGKPVAAAKPRKRSMKDVMGTTPEQKAWLIARVQKDVLQLEERVPWILAKLSWQRTRNEWRNAVQQCCTAEQLVPQLCALNHALHHTRASPGSLQGRHRTLGGGRYGGMAALLETLALEVSAGRAVHSMLDARWDEARGDIETWLESQGSVRLQGMGDTVARAAIALEKAAKKGEEALLQVPLEAMLGNNASAMSVLRDVLQRERSGLLSKPAGNLSQLGGSGGEEEEDTFAAVLGPGLRRRKAKATAGGDAPAAGGQHEYESDSTDVDEPGVRGAAGRK